MTDAAPAPRCPYCDQPLGYVVISDDRIPEAGGIVAAAPVCKSPDCPTNKKEG